MSVIRLADEKGLSPHMLYESVMELSDEGLMTAGCLNHAAETLLADLGLPEYFFRNISKDALKRVLQAIGTNLQFEAGEFILRGAVSEVQFDIDGGVQVRIATPQTRDRMETILNPFMAGHRIEYYFGHEHEYYTYVVRPELCRCIDALEPGESPFAFAQPSALSQIPEETRQRYEGFLRRALANPVPLIEVSESVATAEMRIMFREDFGRSILPVIRKLLADLGMLMSRAYWETFTNPVGRTESICSIYLAGQIPEARLQEAVDQLQALLAIQPSALDQLYVDGEWSFPEYIFSLCMEAFVHNFVYKTSSSDGELMDALQVPSLRQAMAKRIFEGNRSEYTQRVIFDAMRQHPEMIRELYRLFDRQFNPRFKTRPSKTALTRKIEDFRHRISVAFIDDSTGRDIFHFALRLVTETLKTNFYQIRKRSFAFRFGPSVLDPLVFSSPVYGIFFVAGFYAVGTHMRAEDIARGGLRLIRVTSGNYENELDNMPLLNYALGPVAQHLKHKDIAESGAKGVIVPRIEYARDGLSAVLDLTEGILDLIQSSPEVVDFLGRPEMIFFGPDEGTARYMDAVALRARDRGYPHWRTMTTGKSIGIPHDAYGLTSDRRVFGLIPRGEEGTELQIEGVPQLCTTDMGAICDSLEGQIDASGMTTMGVMTCFRTVLNHLGMREEDVGLMMTGGPDGDLGANQIMSFKGRICLIVDGGSVLFDPEGLDRRELLRLAFARHAEPHLNSLAYPEDRLSARGFRIPRSPGRFSLPGGALVDDGSFFHRGFLTDPDTRRLLGDAGIQAFAPCGGFKDTVNAANVRDFIANFPELRVIVEGANVFFEGAAREVIARETPILQIKDSSANKGGVTSSSIAEVLTAFLLGDEYESVLVDDPHSRSEMIRSIFDLIAANATAETRILLALREKTGESLERLSVRTSEDLLAFQVRLYEKINMLLACPDLVTGTLQAYIPAHLEKKLGMDRILRILGQPELVPYRNAMLTKKWAAMALYRHATEWDAFLDGFDRSPGTALNQLLVAALAGE